MATDDIQLKKGYEILNKIKSFLGDNIELYLVGGSVRDLLLDKTPKDYDFTTPLLPDTIEDLVKKAGRHPYIIGKKYGTIGFKFEGYFIEITTFRNEEYLSTSRRPRVEFVNTLEEDLSRRDFTINAIALSSQAVIDPFNGIKDIESGIIRAAGDADTRIGEDPLRILRMIRFVSTLGYDVDESLLQACQKKASSIKIVSRERIAVELDKIIMGKNCKQALEIMAKLDLMPYTLPLLSLQFKATSNKAWDETINAVANASYEDNIRWASLLKNISQPFIGREIDNDLTERLVRMVAFDLKWSKTKTNAIVEETCDLATLSQS